METRDCYGPEDVKDRKPSTARDWTDEDDPGNARNWPFSRKAISTAVVGAIAFVCTLAASIYAPGHHDVASQFDVSTTSALLPLSLYNLGLAFGPVVGTPLSETFGRKMVYVSTMPIFALFIVGSGFSHNIEGLSICRFFAGVFGSPGISFAAATISDFSAPAFRALPMAIYYSMPFLGSVTGPLIGGYVVVGRGWRWTQWTILFFTVAILPFILLISESYKKTILQHRAKELHIEGPPSPERTLAQDIKYFTTKTIIRPLHMLCTESIVSAFCIYTGFNFGLLYTLVVASPHVFETVYGFSLTQQGLSFLGLIIGCLVCPLATIAVDHWLYQPKLARLKKEGDPTDLPPEYRLYTAMGGSVTLTVGMFWFAWSARPTVHWICPVIAQGVTISGCLLIYVAGNLYIMDTYGPLYGASASGANSLARYILSAVFPLFTLQMYGGLGVAWATSLLGLFTMVMLPIPWVLFFWGPELRKRSAYEHGA